jgi:hypothetical protein
MNATFKLKAGVEKFIFEKISDLQIANFITFAIFRYMVIVGRINDVKRDEYSRKRCIFDDTWD